MKLHKSITKKTLTAGVLATILAISALGLSGCGNSGGQKKAEGSIPIKVAYANGVCNAAIFAAVEKGFFEKEGLKVELVQVDPAHISDAVGAGQVDAFQGMASKLVQPLHNGLPIKAVTGLHTGCQRVLVRGDSDIKTVKDLKNKQVGVPGLADAGTILVKRALAREGVGVTEKNMEVDFRVYGRNDLPQVLGKGAIDAFTASDPVGPIAEKEFGYRTILDSAKHEPFSKEYCCVAFVTNKLAKENPEAAARFTRAINKGALWVQKNPEATAKMELDKKYVAGDEKIITELLKSYNFTPSVKGGHDAIRAVATELVQLGILPSNVDGNKLTDESIISFKDVPDKPEDKDIQ